MRLRHRNLERGDMRINAMPCRTRQTSLANYNAKPILTAPVSAGSENTLRLRGFERNVRWHPLSRQVFPALISDVRVTGQCSFRTAFATGNFWVCAQAFPNREQKPFFKTRGFTSCYIFGCVGLRPKSVTRLQTRTKVKISVTKLLLAFGKKRI